MSAALETMTAEEQALMRQMEQDDAADVELPPIEEPAAPAASETEPAVTTKPEDKPAMVDKRALDEERNRRREAEKRATEIERKAAADLARTEERLRLLAEAAQAHVAQATAPAAEEAPPPDFNTDPAGFIQHGFKQLQQALGQINERVQKVETGATQLTQQQRDAQAVGELQNWGMAQEAEYARETPDYAAATQFLAQAREKLIRTMGVSDPMEIRASIAQDVQGLARLSRERGLQFGKVLYDLAVAHGYQKAAPAASDEPAAAGRPNGGTPAPSAENAAERLLRGQDMATTLGSTGGAPRGELTADALGRMSDEEFANYYAKVAKNPAQMRALFGS
jgi:hypothetical protein